MSLKSSRSPNATQYMWLAHALFALTLYGSLIPLRYEPMPWEQALSRFQQIQYYDPTLAFARGDWVVNLVQYAAVSFCYTAALSVDRRRGLRALAAVVVVLAGCAAAVLMEFLQVYFPPRTVSINDIAVECVGVVVGTVAWLLTGQRITDRVRRFWALRGASGLARQALPGYVALLLVAHLMPFDVVLGTDEIALKYHQGRIHLVPFSGLLSGDLKPWVDLLMNLAAFFPLGVFLALVPRPTGSGSWGALRYGLAATIAIESLQLVVFTRYFDVTDILTGTAAVLLGWWSVGVLGGPSLRRTWSASRRYLDRRGPIPWIVLAVVWIGVLILVNWQPFDFTADPTRFGDSDPDLSDEHTTIFGLRRMTWAPLVDYYWGSRFQALDQFLRRSLAFAPLGVLLALAFGRRERLGAAITVLTALVFGTIIEAGQYFIPERHPGTTDLLIQTFGAWLGFKLARHVAHTLQADTNEPRGQAHDHHRPTAPRAGRARDGGPGPSPSRHGKPIGRTPVRVQQALAKAGKRLARRIDGLVIWIESRPYGVRLAIIGAAAVVLSLGLMLLADQLGLF